VSACVYVSAMSPSHHRSMCVYVCVSVCTCTISLSCACVCVGESECARVYIFDDTIS